MLNLYSMRLGVNAMIQLSSLLEKQKYDTLNLADNAISDYGMNAIKTILTSTNIKHLNLSSNMISESGLESIVEEICKSTKLLSIDFGVQEGSIRKNSIGVDGAKWIATIILQNKVLTSIKLQDNDIGITGGEILGTALKQNKTLKSLTVAENQLKTTGAEFILRSAYSLESLDLGKNYIKPNIGPALKEYIEKNQNLLRLNLEFNELMASGVAYLTAGLQNCPNLKSLNLKGNGIRDEGLEYIAKILDVNKTLEELDVSLNEITPYGVQHLGYALPESHLKALNISKNLLGDESLITIADCIQGASEHPLQKLDIGSSRISDKGILHFLEKIDNFSNLRSLRVNDNFISEKIEKILLEILEKNRTLNDFNVKGNRLSLCCQKRIKMILERNTKELEEKEPNKIRTEIYRLKYEQKKIMAAKEKLAAQEKVINSLEEEKTKLGLELDKLKVSEQNKRISINESIKNQEQIIKKKKELMSTRIAARAFPHTRTRAQIHVARAQTFLSGARAPSQLVAYALSPKSKRRKNSIRKRRTWSRSWSSSRRSSRR